MAYTTVDIEKKESMELFGLVPAGEGLNELNLSVRSYNCLVKAGIVNVDDLVYKSKEELSSIKGITKRSVDEIAHKIEQFVKAHPEYISSDFDDYYDDWD